MNKIHTLTCQFCLEGELEYKELKDKRLKYHSTHMWICTDCPIVVFEYYVDLDRKLVNNRLKRKQYED